MQLPRSSTALRASSGDRRGAVLLISFLVMIILFVVVRQVYLAADGDAKVARNSIGVTRMNLAIESSLLEIYDRLSLDGEDTGGGEEGGAGGFGDALGGATGGGSDTGDGGGGGGEGPTDSRRDDWAQIQRTQIGDVELRVLVQDENSKFNLLSLLTEDEDEAEKALERLERILDFYRGGTEFDLDSNEAGNAAEAIAEHLLKRDDSILPRTRLLTDDEEAEDDERGVPLTLRELIVLEPFDEIHFREFRDDEDQVIHSLSSFLTVSTSVSTRAAFEAEGRNSGSGAGGSAEGDPTGDGTEGGAQQTDGNPLDGTGGGDGEPNRSAQEQDLAGASGGGSAPASNSAEVGVQLNLNTTPVAVLKALFDDRDVPYSFWDEVLEYRNTEEEDEGGEEREPVYNQYGEEIPYNQIFTSTETLTELNGWTSLEPIVQTEVQSLFGVESEVFSIYVTARVLTGSEEENYTDFEDPESVRKMEESGNSMTRTVRSVVWRRQGDDGMEIIPLERWEVLDYVPFEVLDFPDDER